MITIDKDIERELFSYSGPFYIQIISALAKYLSEDSIASEIVRKKFYRVFIELAQNVALYSFDREKLSNETTVGSGKIFVIEKQNEFKCITINRIQKEHVPILIKNCSEINATPLNGLRIKKKNLYKLSNSQDTGAHIGIIMIYTYSENPIDFEIIEKEGGLFYFKISATINKKGTNFNE